MGSTTPIRFIPSDGCSARFKQNRSSATLAELTLDGDGVAYATFITDRELSHYIALAAEVEIARHKYPYKTLKQPSAKSRISHIANRSTQYSYGIFHIAIPILATLGRQLITLGLNLNRSATIPQNSKAP